MARSARTMSPSSGARHTCVINAPQAVRRTWRISTRSSPVTSNRMSSRKKASMTPADFRRIALSLEGAEQGSHMGSIDFRVGGRIYATLASQAQGYGNLMLKPEQQAAFCDELPDVFLPIAGGWGRMGMTHI